MKLVREIATGKLKNKAKTQDNERKNFVYDERMNTIKPKSGIRRPPVKTQKQICKGSEMHMGRMTFTLT
jgi:hypothetical protein